MPKYQQRPIEQPLRTGVAGPNFASVPDTLRLIDLIDKSVGKGLPYTLGDLREDELELSRLQLTAADQVAEVGRTKTLFDLPESGQRIRAVRYLPEGKAQFQHHQGAAEIGGLIAERKTSASLFRAKFEVLDTGEVFVAATCLLEDRSERVRSKAMHDWAARWGLEDVWTAYDDSMRKKDLTPVVYRGPLTDKVAKKTLTTLGQLVQ